MGSSNLKFHRQWPLAANGVAAAGVGHVDASPGPVVSRHDLAAALARAAQGDQAALRDVYAATSVKLFGIILRILGRRDLAEDVLQQVYIRVWQRAGEFDPATTSPIEWLVTIARSRALDETRRGAMRPLEDCPELLQALDDAGSAVDPGRSEDRLRLKACLDRLGPEKREVVALAYHYGMTREAIAVSTKRSVATVKAWLRQSLAEIKDCLGR
jgi:RNA polymerase sigma-70 factor (ECF subfamily)